MVLAALLLGAPAAAQQAPALRVERADGSMTDVGVVFERGYAAVQLGLFDDLGWSVTEVGSDITIAVPNQMVVALRIGSPFFRWDGLVLQLSEAPYRDANRVLVPVQLLTDFFPTRLPDLSPGL